jgi:FlaA1/EpsC-like NDP-sugar epimerase
LADLTGKVVLVTGGTGFIGSCLAGSLMKGYEVVVLNNFDYFNCVKEGNITRARRAGDDKFHLIRGNILNRESLLHAVKDLDVVFHEATREIRYCDLNPVIRAKGTRLEAKDKLNDVIRMFIKLLEGTLMDKEGVPKD